MLHWDYSAAIKEWFSFLGTKQDLPELLGIVEKKPYFFQFKKLKRKFDILIEYQNRLAYWGSNFHLIHPVFHFLDDTVFLSCQATLIYGHAQQLLQQVLGLIQANVLQRNKVKEFEKTSIWPHQDQCPTMKNESIFFNFLL